MYTHVNERDWEREAWFEVDIESRDYRVVTCQPKLETEGLERVVKRLNENQDLGMFLKGMRDVFEGDEGVVWGGDEVMCAEGVRAGWNYFSEFFTRC